MPPSPRCSRCRVAKVNGVCPHGCEKFAAPHARQAEIQLRARRRAKEATAPLGVRVGAPKRVDKPKCSRCQAQLREGECPYGCKKFLTKQQLQRKDDARARVSEREQRDAAAVSVDPRMLWGGARR